MLRRNRLKVLPGSADSAPRTRYVLNDQIGFQLRVATQRHNAIFMARMVGGLTLTQFSALAKLYEVGPCSQNQLGRLIYVDAATIKGVVDRLHARGLLMTSSDSLDRRRRAVVLTDVGRKITEAALHVSVEIGAVTFAPLTADEQRKLTGLLKRIA
jgi:MarR family transcriptional regulator, lower aerobic nicotinate degradation pathway regulator